jgi:hypothetical protein
VRMPPPSRLSSIFRRPCSTSRSTAS